MSVNSGSPHRGGKVRSFGHNAELLYTLSEPRDGNSRIGAILWGLGVAEVKTARRLAKKGIVSLQVRINGPEFYDDARRNEIYRKSGVDYTKLAMDKLAAEHGVTSFILMGNCACANLCFHAAVCDPRVVGLILTNPYIAKAQMLRTVLWRKLSQPAVWKRLRTDGTVQARKHLGTLRRLFADRLGLNGRLFAKTSASPTEMWQPLEFPEELGRALRSLCDRELRILVACTTSDDSFRYLSRRYGTELSELEARGNLRFASVTSSAHVFSTDDAAASLLNDAISGWIEGTTFIPNARAQAAGDGDLGAGHALAPT